MVSNNSFLSFCLNVLGEILASFLRKVSIMLARATTEIYSYFLKEFWNQYEKGKSFFTQDRNTFHFSI